MRHSTEYDGKRGQRLAPHNPRIRKPITCVISQLLALSFVLQLLVQAQPASANGGTIQVSSEPVGPYEVTVLTSPSPLVAGTADITVAVIDPRIVSPSQDPTALDAQVEVTAQPADNSSPPASFPATHDQATNKLLYQANVALPSSGQWQFTVRVSGPDGGGSVQFAADVSPSLFAMDPTQFICTAIPVLIIVTVGIVALVRSRRKQSTPGSGSEPLPEPES